MTIVETIHPKINYHHGPFGHYDPKTAGGVLNALYHLGVPMHVCEDVTLEPGLINYRNSPFATYKFYEGIEQPLFMMTNSVFMHRQSMIRNFDGSLSPKFHLSMGPHCSASLIVTDNEATPELYDFLMGTMLTNDMRAPGYRLHKDAGAFFQGGHGSPDGKWFYIEFSHPAGAQAFVDYINRHFIQPSKDKHAQTQDQTVEPTE